MINLQQQTAIANNSSAAIRRLTISQNRQQFVANNPLPMIQLQQVATIANNSSTAIRI